MKTALATLLMLSLVSAFPASAEDASTAIVTDLENVLTGIFLPVKTSTTQTPAFYTK